MIVLGRVICMYQIVIVDDEKEISSGFAQYFPWNTLGYSVVKSFSGAQEALDYIMCNTVDVVVSDVMMPGMNGVELAQKIHESGMPYKPSIILFTAYEKFEYARQAVRYGCMDYLLKSMEYEELIDAFQKIRKRLDGASAEQKKVSNGEEEGDCIILAMRQYVNKDPVTATLAGAAEAAYLSPSYASRYFKQRIGMGFSEYVLEQKMHLAAELLEQPQYRIYEISEQMGYMNPVNFARAFRRYYHVSPHNYRSQKLGRTVIWEESDK